MPFMKGKVVPAMMLALLLTGMLALAFNIQPVEASGTIYIRADGSIDPPEAPISTADNVTYTFTDDINDSIVVERDSIAVDGAGYTVTGSGSGNGITVTGRSNVTVRNMTTKNFDYGIQLYYSSNDIVSGNNVTANSWAGIFLDHSSNNIVSGNNATANNGYGIWLASSSNDIVSGNNVTANSWAGILLGSSSNNTLSGNVMGGNRYNFGVVGSALSDYLQSVDTSNLVDGKPVYYFMNQSDIVVNADAYPQVGYLGFVNCANVTVQGLNLTSNRQGLLLVSTNNSKITSNNIANNDYGVELEFSSNNTLSGNNVANSYCGILLYSSGNNVFYHNNFINNTHHVYISPSYANSWDDGYPSGGNYWSDYTGVDEKSGPNQDQPGSDGIGDTPYVIFGLNPPNSDRYPLMVPTETYISVPYHSQTNGYYCGPAALEMVFDFYGPDIPQLEIADVARTAADGTYTSDMIRAAQFSNLSTSVGNEMPESITGYTSRKLGYAAFEYSPMTINDLKSLIAAGYPIIVLTTWHFRVAVGYNSTHITFQDSYYGEMFNMTYQEFDTDWDYSGHWGLLVAPWKIEVSALRNVFLGSVFNVTASVTYPSSLPFDVNQYPASAVNATVALPAGLSLVSGETTKKTIDAGTLVAGTSANVTWAVQVNTLGNYTISVEAEGKVNGSVPSLPSYPEPYNYEDRIGGFGQSAVTAKNPDETPPTTSNDYDSLWHTSDFAIILTATDDLSGVAETYYKINDGPTKTVSADGQPLITTEGADNKLEYWSVDNADNEELPHKILTGIKLDKTYPTIETPSRTPDGDVLPDQPVKVSVNVTDATSQVENATLYYTLNDGTTWEEPILMNYNSSTGLYEATIPGQQQVGTWVRFKIVAYDHAGNNATMDGTQPYCVYQVIPEFPSFLILPLFMIATLLAVIVCRRRTKISDVM